MAESSDIRVFPETLRGAPPAPEPSMEDILASIRRILNDDSAVSDPPSIATDAPPAIDPLTDDDVLVLDDTMLARPANDHVADRRPAAPPAPVNQAAAKAEETPAMADIETITQAAPDALLAPEAQSAAEAAFGSLMQKVAQERALPVYRGGPTIEDLVREEIRPVLKSWLDTQLPDLVERLVRVEIERLTAKR